MRTITLDDFAFLCELQCPYEGYVRELGEVYCQPVITASDQPETGAASDGTFLSTDYTAIVAPSPKLDVQQISEEIQEKLLRQTADGFEFWDFTNEKAMKFGKDIKLDVAAEGNEIGISVRDNEGNMFTYKGDTEAFKAQAKASFPWGKALYDASSLGFSYSEYRWNKKMTTAQKSKKVYDAKKVLKKTGVKVKARNADLYRSKIPKALKVGGRVLGAISFGLLLNDIRESRGVKGSHILDAAGLGVCFLGPYGLAAGAVYFVGDLIYMGYTYFDTGEARRIGDELNDWIEKEFEVENGVLWDLNWLITPVEDAWGEMKDFFSPSSTQYIF